jgi:CubicO group peptidase (beta-lactamase class C family)
MKIRIVNILFIGLLGAQPNSDLDQIILDHMNSGYIPGLSACIVVNDQVIWSNSYGTANITLNIPVTEDIHFLLASISKLVTATAVMQLYEDGSIELHDSINQYLPFTVTNPFHPDTEITLYMLLTHTSSINEDLTFSEEYSIFGNNPEMDLEYFLSNYLVVGGEFYSSNNYYNYEPGDQWNYSNIGFALIALIVESIAEQSFEDYCDVNIFDPLGMEETSWHFEEMDESTVAMPYEWMPGWEGMGHYFIPYYPSAQLRSSVNELSSFLIGYMENFSGLLGDETIELILTEHIDDGWSWMNMSEGWGLGWYHKIINGRDLWGHNGEMWGVLTEMFFSPEDNVGIIILTNGGDYYGSWYTDVIAIENAMLDYGYEYLESNQVININYNAGWNIIGLPLEVEYAYYQTLYPESIEGTLYSFDGNYDPVENLINGEGYWLRFNEEGSTNISGTIINELTINLHEGWNLITGGSTSLNILDIQDPDGIIISGTIYGFNNGVYTVTENIEPGKGYWVRTNTSGSITIIGH